MSEPTRKLAAIVFTDIVGFTKLTADDQSKASSLLKQQRELLRPIVESFNGSWIKEIGDGLLLIFDTVTDAVNCSIKIQEETKSIDDLDLRIGIHQGEVLLEENDVIGDDVNIASRIEPFSASGGIAISNKVHDAIIRETGFETKYLGKPKLKGVAQEVKVYCITSHGLPETKVSRVSAKLEPEGFQWNVFSFTGAVLTVIGVLFWINVSFLGIGIADTPNVPSIAILPLDNKGAEEDKFYAYGISSDLIADITSAGLIRVAGLKDIEKLDYKNLRYEELANKLLVRYIGQGTLWKMDTVFQLSMEIYDTKLSEVAYTKRWQTNWKNLASIKDDLSETILGALEFKINKVSGKQIVVSNPEAYEYYLRAKHKFYKRQNIDDIEIARGLLKKAIELDNNLIEAKSSLAGTYISTGDFDMAMEIYIPTLRQAEEQGDKRRIGYLLKDIGVIFLRKGDHDKALEYYDRSLAIAEELDNKAGIFMILNNFGIIFLRKGDHDKALEYYDRSLAIAEELDNKAGIGMILNNTGNIYLQKGDHKALEYYERSLTISEELGDKSGMAVNINNIGNIYLQKGDYDQYLEYSRKSFKMHEEIDEKDGIANSLNNIGWAYINKGDYDNALDHNNRAFEIAEKIGDKSGMFLSTFCTGAVYWHKGDYDKTLDFLEKSLFIQKETGYTYLRLRTTTYLYLTYKHLGKDYNKNDIYEIIKNTEDIDFEINIRLYELLEDKSYLETAYNQLQDKASAMEKELKDKFLSYPIPKQIIQEWERVS